MRRVLALAACALAAPAALAAQAGWSVEAVAGHSAFRGASTRVGATSASLSVALDGARRWGYASAGAPLESTGPAWGAAGAGGFVARAPGRGLTLGVNLAASAFGYARADTVPSGGGASVEAIPTAILRRGRMRAQAGAGFVGVVERSEGLLAARRGFLDANAALAWAPAPGVELSAGTRYVLGPDEGVPFAGGGAQVERAWGEAWAYAGAWLRSGYPRPPTSLGAGVRVRVHDRMRVGVAFLQEPSDPLFRSLPRRGVSVSLRQGFGPRPPAARPPAAALPVVAGGLVTFRLPRTPDDAGPPSVLGDFNGWHPVRMSAEDGFWTATLRIAPGTYHFAFRTADGRVHVPDGFPRVDDGFGGSSAVLVVTGM
jgi:hypothetical protein